MESDKINLFREVPTLRNYATQTIYCSWIKRFIIFNQKKYPSKIILAQLRTITYTALDN